MSFAKEMANAVKRLVMPKRRTYKAKQQHSVKTTATALPEVTGEATVSAPAPAWRRHLVPLMTLVLCTVIYGGTLDHPLVFDDETYLIHNPYFTAQSFAYPLNYTAFIRSAAANGYDPDLAVNFAMRPIAYATFHLNWLLHGFQTHGFRLVNILLHICSSIFIWGLLRALLRRLEKAGRELRSGTQDFLPAMAALLFAVHPLAVESVTYVVQRFTSQAAMLGLLALWMHFLALESESRSPRRRWLRVASILAMLLAMLTKECSIMIPLMALLLDIATQTGSGLRAALRRSLPLLVLLPLIPAQALLASAALHGGAVDLSAGLNIVNSRDEPLAHSHYLITQIVVVAHYLRLVVWPSGLNIDPEWPLWQSLAEPTVLAALSVHVLLLTTAALIYRRWRADARASLALVFVLWFYGTVSVSSGLVPLPDLAADHRAYLPALGILIAAACLLDVLRERLTFAKGKLIARVTSAACVVALGLTTLQRNAVWSSADGLWSDTAAKSPGKFRVWSNLGVCLSRVGKENDALECFEKSVELEPRFVTGTLNLSNSLLRLNRPQESLESLNRLIDKTSSAAKIGSIQYTRGQALLEMGKHEEAAAEFQKILALEPQNPLIHKVLGIALARGNRGHSALLHFREAHRLAPEDKRLPHIIQQLENELRQAGLTF